MSAVMKIKQEATLPTIETITPNLAKRYLATMGVNRPQTDGKIVEYALAMEAGTWALNGECLKFNTEGSLIDGQNRLQACILADRPFITYVIRNISDPRAFATIDVGKTRTHTDVLHIAGIQNQANIVSAANLLMLYERKEAGWSGPTKTRYTRAQLAKMSDRLVRVPNKSTSMRKDELLEWVAARNEDLQRAVRKAHTSGAKRLAPTGTLAAVYYIGEKSGKIDMEKFIDDLAEGVNLGPRDPVHALREKLLTSATSKLSRLNRFTIFGLILKAMTKRINKENCARLFVADGEDFPRV